MLLLVKEIVVIMTPEHVGFKVCCHDLDQCPVDYVPGA